VDQVKNTLHQIESMDIPSVCEAWYVQKPEKQNKEQLHQFVCFQQGVEKNTKTIGL